MRCCLSEWDLGEFWETIECWKNTLFKGEAASLCLWIAAMENVCERNQKATFLQKYCFLNPVWTKSIQLLSRFGLLDTSICPPLCIRLSSSYILFSQKSIHSSVQEITVPSKLSSHCHSALNRITRAQNHLPSQSQSSTFNYITLSNTMGSLSQE